MPVAGSVFRVGEEYHSFEYQPTAMTLNGETVYRCIRSHDNRPAVSAERRLFLYVSDCPKGCWIATEAAIGADEQGILVNGNPKFITTTPVADITAEGDVLWGWYDADNKTWCVDKPMRFHTYNFTTAGGGGSAAAAATAATASGAAGPGSAEPSSAAPPGTAGPGTVVLMPSYPPIPEAEGTAAAPEKQPSGQS